MDPITHLCRVFFALLCFALLFYWSCALLLLSRLSACYRCDFVSLTYLYLKSKVGPHVTGHSLILFPYVTYLTYVEGVPRKFVSYEL